MKTLQQGWLEYKKAAYPKGCNAIQERETHQAFFSGALVMFTEVARASELDEAAAGERVDRLYKEAMAILDARAMNLEARN